MTRKIANTEGINLLGRVLQSRMQEVGEQPPLLDFGEIQEDMSLLTNKYPIPIPPTDYFLCRQLTLGATGGVLATTAAAGSQNDGTHSHGPSGSHSGHENGDGIHSHTDEGAHVHDVRIPEKMRGVKPGDHVLLAWVDADPVVIDLLVLASEVES